MQNNDIGIDFPNPDKPGKLGAVVLSTVPFLFLLVPLKTFHWAGCAAVPGRLGRELLQTLPWNFRRNFTAIN